MKTNTFTLVTIIFLLISISAFSQIKVLSNGKVGLGINNTNPTYPVDILGSTAIRFPGFSNYIKINGDGGFGWNLTSSTPDNGYIGYYSAIYGLNSRYIYSNGYLISSDERLKNNILPLTNAISIIKKLKPVSFNYNIDYSKVEDEKTRTKLENDDKNRVGFIAQEVQKVLPETVKEKDSDSTLCIRMLDFIPLLVKGMQEQSVQIDSLKTVIQEMKESESMLKSAMIPGNGNQSEFNAMLYQNVPNPFTQETKIVCLIPQNAGISILYIYNMNGTQLQQYKVDGFGKQSVTINGSSLDPGMYLYALVIDGKEVDTKRMILTK